jgi:hypothetical protein
MLVGVVKVNQQVMRGYGVGEREPWTERRMQRQAPKRVKQEELAGCQVEDELSCRKRMEVIRLWLRGAGPELRKPRAASVDWMELPPQAGTGTQPRYPSAR